MTLDSTRRKQHVTMVAPGDLGQVDVYSLDSSLFDEHAIVNGLAIADLCTCYTHGYGSQPHASSVARGVIAHMLLYRVKVLHFSLVLKELDL